jgi:hypothetical protein
MPRERTIDCTKTPDRWARRTGSAALVTFTTPKRLVSIWVRKSSSAVSSIGALFA